MASFNKVVLIGNVTKNLELKFTPKGKAVTKIGLAINRYWTNDAGERKEDVTFVDVDVFGRTAENCAQYLSRGKSVLVEGRIKLDTWDDKQTGQKRSRLGVVAESVQFLGSRTEQGDAQSAAEAPQPDAPADVAAPAPKTDAPDGDDVPF
jgi:single-strand DNA-binding protein